MALSAAALSGCGAAAHYVNKPRRPLPLNLTVYIGSTGAVSVSPGTVGAGPAVFFVTNQAARAESLRIAAAGGQVLASTGPINPQAATRVGLDLDASRTYVLSASAGGAAGPSAQLHVGAARPGAESTLLAP